MKKTIKERINSKIYISENGCWNWTGYRNKKGYGCLQRNGKNFLAHRASFIEFIGEIKDGNYVLHKCDNPGCVNPEHLFQGTQFDNMRDMFSKGRQNVPKGISHACTKLTEEKVIEIFNSNENQRELAKRMGVSKGLIWAIKKGAAWSHLTKALSVV